MIDVNHTTDEGFTRVLICHGMTAGVNIRWLLVHMGWRGSVSEMVVILIFSPFHSFFTDRGMVGISC